METKALDLRLYVPSILTIGVTTDARLVQQRQGIPLTSARLGADESTDNLKSYTSD
ncbi:MAG: hypothetical protein JRM77_04285 [Nitrososphaerota archaeon]|nr:hypothetical protein [Nitrososphaerota archaeon]